MKKILALILCFVFIFCFTGCGSKNNIKALGLFDETLQTNININMERSEVKNTLENSSKIDVSYDDDKIVYISSFNKNYSFENFSIDSCSIKDVQNRFLLQEDKSFKMYSAYHLFFYLENGTYKEVTSEFKDYSFDNSDETWDNTKIDKSNIFHVIFYVEPPETGIVSGISINKYGYGNLRTGEN